MERITHLLQSPPSGVKGKVVNNHIMLDIIGKDVHYWSPQLSFRVEAAIEGQEQSVISGLVGPRPEVWTMFMFIYFTIGVLGFFASSYGIIQWTLGNYSHLVLVLPLTIILLLTAYGVGKYGESLAKEQIEILKQFLRNALLSFEV